MRVHGAVQRRCVFGCVLLMAAFGTLSASGCALGVGQETVPLAESSTPGGVRLGREATSVPLRAVPDARSREPLVPFAARLKGLGRGAQIYLTLSGVTAQVTPESTYNVYLNLPGETPARGAEDPHYLGTISFYDVLSHAPSDISLNITRHLGRLADRGELGDDLRLTIVAAGTRAPSAGPDIRKVLITAR